MNRTIRHTLVAFTGALLLVPLAALHAADSDRPIRAGMIGFDTSHVVVFTKALNNPENTGDLAGVKVAAFPGGNPRIGSFR